MQKREALLHAALVLFAQRGFHGTPVPDVAERARVATGTLYRYFEDKEALANAVHRRCTEQLSQALIEGFPSDATVREQLAELWRRLWRFAVEHPEMLDFLELHDHETYLDDYSREVQQRLLQPMVALVTEAQTKHVVKSEPPVVLLAMAWGAFIGLYKATRRGLVEMNDGMRQACEEAVWHALRA